MELQLSKEVSQARVINGFPGFGLVGTIATEFLVDHLKAELIGKFWFESQSPSIAVHDGKIINPISIYYNEKYNLVIIHSIAATNGIEWECAKVVRDVLHKVGASELISLEGVGLGNLVPKDEEPRVFYYTNQEEKAKLFEEKKFQQLSEGVIIGVTASLLLQVQVPTSAFFVETHTQLPDSKAAAKLIEVLDQYIGMDVDYSPLLETAEKFEEKLKTLLEKSQTANDIKSKKDLSYVG
ncbi:proteasome assembly chaperone family protein [Candidatus Woesearchaeota archaeon]|nr:proteasome assembly chaperone family protein [Candidatus Woesearchaeota archaeon]